MWLQELGSWYVNWGYNMWPWETKLPN